MNSHDYANKLKGLAEFLLDKPEFETPFGEASSYERNKICRLVKEAEYDCVALQIINAVLWVFIALVLGWLATR